MNSTWAFREKNQRIPPPSSQWPVWLPLPSPLLLLGSELSPYWSPSLMSQPHLPPTGCCPQAGSQPGMEVVGTWREWEPISLSSTSLRHCPPTQALAEAPGLCLKSCCLSASPVSCVSATVSLSLSLPPCLHEDHFASATLPVSTFLPYSCSSLPTAFFSLCIWPYL